MCFADRVLLFGKMLLTSISAPSFLPLRILSFAAIKMASHSWV